MSATIIWDSTGPPGTGDGVAPRARKTRGARDENHQADIQTSHATIVRNWSQRQYPRILPPLVAVRYALSRATWKWLRQRCFAYQDRRIRKGGR
jgi:hypothetical protein